MAEVDIVVVFHNEVNHRQAAELQLAVDRWEHGRFEWIGVDNRVENRGFAPGCNYGAKQGTSPIIGFLNPDVEVSGPFLDTVTEVLQGDVVITGERFAKPDRELRIWGVTDWVCGAAFFVERRFFESMGGFDEGFVWGWEETDLIRKAVRAGWRVCSTRLPIQHVSPAVDTPEDVAYKRRHFDAGAARYYERWGRKNSL